MIELCPTESALVVIECSDRKVSALFSGIGHSLWPNCGIDLPEGSPLADSPKVSVGKSLEMYRLEVRAQVLLLALTEM